MTTLLILALIFAGLTINLLFGEGLGLIVTLLHLFALLITFITYKKQNKWQIKRGLGLLIIMILLSVTYIFRDVSALHLLNMCVFYVLFLAYNVHMLSKQPFRVDSTYLTQILEMIVMPFGELAVPYQYIGQKLKFKKIKDLEPKTKQILIGLVISIPILLVFIALMASADDVFRSIVSIEKLFIMDFINSTTLPKTIIFLLTTSYVFGHYHYLLYKERTVLEKPIVTRKYHDTIITTITILVNVLFAVFIFVQFRYLFSNSIIKGMTYSSYARKGFFELTVISLIVIGLILILKYFSKDKLNKILQSLLLLSTMVIAYSAIFRMNLYLEAYGYTWLRIVSLCFIYLQIIIMMATLMAIWRDIRIKTVIATMYLIAYLTLNFVNMDAIIIKGNMNRYFDGHELDTYYFSIMSHDADESLIYYENLLKDKPEHKKAYDDIQKILSDKRISIRTTKLINYNYTQHKAIKILK